MKITVIGGTGLIGSQLVATLRDAGHDVVPASLSSGVDLLTGAGLDEALHGAEAVVNVTNSPTFDEHSLDFFRTTVGHLLRAGEKAGVRHQVALSIVGVDQVPELDYYRAKALQEELLRQGPTPYSLVRATQFFEFMDAVLSWTADGDVVRLPATPLRPIASADVVRALADVATAAPLDGTVDVAGPDVLGLDEIGRITLAARGDGRRVVTDGTAGMFAVVRGDVLVGGPDARRAPTRYRDWLRTSPAVVQG
ncbi:SDR family oxidoreductase [Streptomyces sp. NPDC096079]|uniref:SDR family oxidoreductase n=1 Tax=Streptomyces sp. NPDC096079 TaxID=3155820 RepID=UPI003322F603